MLFEGDPILDLLYKAIELPQIIIHPEPRKMRMRYVNHVRNQGTDSERIAWKDKLSFLTRGKGIHGRILIGPRMFDMYLNPYFSLNECTQMELQVAFLQTYPANFRQTTEQFKSELHTFDKRQITSTGEVYITEDERAKLRQVGDIAYKNMKFLTPRDEIKNIEKKPSDQLTPEEVDAYMNAAEDNIKKAFADPFAEQALIDETERAMREQELKSK